MNPTNTGQQQMGHQLVRFVPGATGGCMVHRDLFDNTDTLRMPEYYEATEFGHPFIVEYNEVVRPFYAKQMMETVRKSTVSIAPHDVVETITIYENDMDPNDRLFVIVNKNIRYVIYNNQLYRDPDERIAHPYQFLHPSLVRDVILANQVF